MCRFCYRHFHNCFMSVGYFPVHNVCVFEKVCTCLLRNPNSKRNDRMQVEKCGRFLVVNTCKSQVWDSYSSESCSPISERSLGIPSMLYKEWLVCDSTPSLLPVLRYFRAVSRQQHDIDETESDASATTLLLLLSRRHQQSTPLIPSNRCCRIGYVD